VFFRRRSGRSQKKKQRRDRDISAPGPNEKHESVWT
jgi:hypothetical protein